MNNIGNNISIEIFQQSSSENTICFRRVSDCFNLSVSYEAGFGQAMYVFEKERGFHFVASIQIHSDNIMHKVHSGFLSQYLHSLYENFEGYFKLKVFSICRKLGIPYISLEGYYDFISQSLVAIVDIDLPFDYVFFQKAKK